MEEKKKYARGKHPNSQKNIAEHKYTSEQDREKASEAGKKGGKASQKVQHEKVIIQKIVEQAVNSIYKDKDTGEEGNPIVMGVAKIVARLAKKGDIKDLEAITKYLGQEPAQKVEQRVITPEVDFDKLAQLRKDLKDDE